MSQILVPTGASAGQLAVARQLASYDPEVQMQGRLKLSLGLVALLVFGIGLLMIAVPIGGAEIGRAHV